jgi:hypothetical protein
MLFPTAEAEMPKMRPAATKLCISATCTNTGRPVISFIPDLSILKERNSSLIFL